MVVYFYDADLTGESGSASDSIDFFETRATANHTVVLDSVDSTNAVARHLIEQQQIAFHGTSVIIAREQTQGRGRLDHTWESRRGESLTASFIVTIPKTSIDDPNICGWIPMIAGISVVDALHEALRTTHMTLTPEYNQHTTDEHTHPTYLAQHATQSQENERFMLKWPNDIVVHGKKIGGILTQVVPIADNEHDVAIIFGVGLNIAIPQHQLPTDQSTSLQLITYGNQYDAEHITDVITAHIVQSLREHLHTSIHDPYAYAHIMHNRLLPECYSLNKPVLVHFADGSTLRGTATTINEDASLTVIDSDNNEHRISTADVGILTE